MLNGEVLSLDKSGRPCKTKQNWPKSTTLAAVATAWITGQPLMQAVTQCGITGLNITAPISSVVDMPTNTGVAWSAMDKVTWIFEDVDGNHMLFETGGPVPAQIMANGIDVDATITAVANFIAWVVATYNSPEGKAITVLIRAYRDWRTRKKKNQ